MLIFQETVTERKQNWKGLLKNNFWQNKQRAIQDSYQTVWNQYSNISKLTSGEVVDGFIQKKK